MLDEKFNKLVEIPKMLRVDETFKRKAEIMRRLRGRTLSGQLRFSLTKGLDQEFTECGKEAMDLFCKEMFVEKPGPVKESVNVSKSGELFADRRKRA